MTPDEAAYLEQLGFVPSAFSTSTFVRMSGSSVDAVVERVPHSHQQALRWRARKPGTWSRTQEGRSVEANELIALIVMAKMEGIL